MAWANEEIAELLREYAAGFSAIRVVVHLDTDADEAAVSELHRRVAATSPVGHTLSRAVPVEISHE